MLEFHPIQLYDSLPLLPDSENIRVLDLEAHNGDVQTQLIGRLRVIDLKASPEYTALSYVWGPWSSPADIVVCNGCRIKITANCYSALRSLRSLYGNITVWVDSFCINQSDDMEKAHQIQLMGQIYTFAQPTYVWLGNGTESTDRAMECIEQSSRLRFVPVHIPWLQGKQLVTLEDSRKQAYQQLLRLWLTTTFGKAFPFRTFCFVQACRSDCQWDLSQKASQGCHRGSSRACCPQFLSLNR
jgi:hypothetical protein